MSDVTENAREAKMNTRAIGARMRLLRDVHHPTRSTDADAVRRAADSFNAFAALAPGWWANGVAGRLPDSVKDALTRDLLESEVASAAVPRDLLPTVSHEAIVVAAPSRKGALSISLATAEKVVGLVNSESLEVTDYALNEIVRELFAVYRLAKRDGLSEENRQKVLRVIDDACREYEASPLAREPGPGETAMIFAHAKNTREKLDRLRAGFGG
jgi:hypothetical protein